jgi:hypothetical protein
MQRKRPRTIITKMTAPRTAPTMATVVALCPLIGDCVASPVGDVDVPVDGAWLIALAVDDIVHDGVVAVVEGSTIMVEDIVIDVVLDSPDSDSPESESTRDYHASLL